MMRAHDPFVGAWTYRGLLSEPGTTPGGGGTAPAGEVAWFHAVRAG
jgi:hypothetical protein